MTPKPDDVWELCEALCALRIAFLRPAVMHAGDRITVEIGPEAGRRFEAWIHAAAPAELRLGFYNWGGEIDRDTDSPKRFVDLQDVRIVWPTGRMAVPGGGTIPRPLPHRFATLGVNDFSVTESEP